MSDANVTLVTLGSGLLQQRVEKNTHRATQPTCPRHVSKDGAGWASGASRLLAVDRRCFGWLKGVRGGF